MYHNKTCDFMSMYILMHLNETIVCYIKYFSIAIDKGILSINTVLSPRPTLKNSCCCFRMYILNVYIMCFKKTWVKWLQIKIDHFFKSCVAALVKLFRDYTDSKDRMSSKTTPSVVNFIRRLHPKLEVLPIFSTIYNSTVNFVLLLQLNVHTPKSLHPWNKVHCELHENKSEHLAHFIKIEKYVIVTTTDFNSWQLHISSSITTLLKIIH